MILRKIRVEGYKALRNPIELDGMGVGIHLIHGPNETGKSTLLSAVARAFFDRYNTQDQEIRALRPWGTDLAPRVSVEFETSGKRYRLDKRFLDEEGSSLSEWSGTRFERVADSVKADDRIRAMLMGSAARSGASGLSNWGLARLLWLTQSPSRLEAPSLDEPLKQHLLGVLGSAALSEAERKLIGRLDSAYEVFYTTAKGSERKGSPLQEAREKLARAEESLALWKTKWDEVSRWNEAALESQSQVKDIEAERAGLESRISALRTQAASELELEGAVKVKEQEFLVAQGRWKALHAAWSEIQETERSIARHRQDQAAQEPVIRTSEAEQARWESELREAEASLQASADESSRCAKEMAETAELSEAKSILQRKAAWAAQLEAASGIEGRLNAKKEEYASRKRPKEAELGEANAWHAEIEALGARIADLSIEVTLMPERAGLAVEWRTGEGASSRESGADLSALRFRSPDQGELVMPGVGKLLVRSGAEDSKKLRERRAEIERALRAKLDAFSVDSLPALQALRQATAELEAEGQGLRAALQSTLAPKFKAVTELAAELGRADSALAERLGRLGLTEAELSSRPIAEMRELSSRAQRSKEAQDSAKRARDQASASLLSSRKRLDQARSSLEQARQAAELLDQQLRSKLSASGGRETLERELGAAALGKSSVEKERDALASRLPPPAERASLRLGGLERALAEARGREELARKAFNETSALLSHAQGQGYYSRLAAAEEERALAAELVARRESEAQGTKLLRALAHAKRDRMNSNLLAPIEESVTRIFDHVRGSPSPSRLAFGSDLHELGFQVGAEKAQPLDLLSLGTQEQAMFALRLAFGELLASRGPAPEAQLVVLDDPLVNADPDRQERARQWLARAAEKLQILVLTARPEDYRMLSPKEYDLARLKEESPA